MNDERDDTPQVVEFAGVRFGPDDVTEMDGEQVMVKVARRDIKSITLRHGFHSAHPLTQVVAGAVLTAIGLLPTWHFAYWLVRGGTFTTIEAVMMGFVFLGPWVMVDARPVPRGADGRGLEESGVRPQGRPRNVGEGRRRGGTTARVRRRARGARRDASTAR